MAFPYSLVEGVALLLLVVLAPVLTASRLTDAMSGFETAPVAAQHAPPAVLYDHSFPVREGQALDVALGSGSVRIETTNAREASVVVTGTGRDARAEFARLGFSADVRDGRLVVQNRPSPSARSAEARFVYTIRVPQASLEARRAA